MNYFRQLVSIIGVVAIGMLGACPVLADPVKIPAGMSVALELQHHVNSGYTPTGSPIYFRVSRDVVVDGQTLIAKGTLVTGKMEQAQDRGMVGRSGSMTLGVRTVRAVDGLDIPIEADLSKQGRSRAGATVAWTLFWGIPGLVTHGVNPYLEKGFEVTATVVTEVAVDPSHAAPPPPPVAAAAAAIHWYKPDGVKRDGEIKFDIERKTKVGPIQFSVTLPDGSADPNKALAGIELLEVDGVPVPERVAALSAAKGVAEFDGWSVVRFCRDGINTLTLGGMDEGGQPYRASYQIHVKVKKKG